MKLRAIVDFASSIKIDCRIPIQRYVSEKTLFMFNQCNFILLHRYYRSGTEMLRMADVYHKEGNLESAYALYLKFLT